MIEVNFLEINSNNILSNTHILFTSIEYKTSHTFLPHHYICDKRLRLRQQMLEAEDMSVNVVKM